MPNPKINVICSINRIEKPFNPYMLYNISCSPTPSLDGKWRILDLRKPSLRGENKKKRTNEILAALQNIFEKKERISRFFQLRYKERDNYKDENERTIEINKLEEINKEVIIQDSTSSVFLGLYITLLHEIEGKRFNAKWDSITVTGDIIIEDDNVRLFGIRDEWEKFKDYKEELGKSRNLFDKDLFIYISDNENKKIESDRNITVKYFRPDTHKEEIIKCVFERQWEDELQHYLSNYIRNRKHNIEYIKSKDYLIIEKEMFTTGIDGYLILGEGESGKSDMAEALARSLMDEEDYYAPIWIYIANDKLKESVSYDLPMEGAIREYIIKKIKEKGDCNQKRPELTNFSDLSKFLQQNKYILVIDNLEIDNINDVLQGIKNITDEIPENKPFIIITSRTGNNDKNIIAFAEEEMKLKKVNPPILCKEDIEELFAKIINSNENILQLKKDNKYDEFIEELKENFDSFPGLIIPAINPINHGMSIESLLPDLRGMRNDRIEEKALKIYRTIFSMLDEISQTVLFKLLNMISPDTRVSEDKLISAFEESPDIIRKVLNDLIDKMIIFKEEEINLTQYGMKRVAFLAFMFGDIFNIHGKYANKKKNKRKEIVDDKWSLHMALRYEISEETIDVLISDIKDPSDIGDIYCKEALIKNPQDYILKSIEYHRIALDEALKNNEKGNEHYILIVKRYLQALNRATRINESWDELGKFLEEIGIDLQDAELQKEIGDAHYSLGFYIERTEQHYTLANKAYETAINLYNKETDKKAIRLTMINQAINYGALSEVPNSAIPNHKSVCLEKAKNLLLNKDYFDESEVSQKNDPKEYAEKEMALANIYLKLAEVIDKKTNKEKSIALYINAIAVYSSMKDRIGEALAWAELSVAYMYGLAIEDKVEREKNIELSKEACTEHALKVFHKNDFPVYFAETKNHLGNARKAQIDKDRINEEFFKATDEIFEEAEVIFQGDKMYHFMAGRVKHNRGDLYLKYALICPNDKKEKYFKLAIETLNDANYYRQKYPRYHVPTLRILGYTHLKYSLIIQDSNIEKKNHIEETIKIIEMGLEIYEKEAFNLSDEYKWLYHNNGLAHEQNYKFSNDIKDIEVALSTIKKAIELTTDEKEIKRFKDDHNRILKLSLS